MPHAAPPSSADVKNLLQALPNPILLPAGFDLDSEVAGALQEWNRRTGYLPFWQESNEPVTRFYDPPGPMRRMLERGGDCILPLRNGILQIQQVWRCVDQTVAFPNGTQCIQGNDFFPAPSEAPTLQPWPAPYTHLEFGWPQIGQPQSIAVVGVWGYCQGDIPDDAWIGMRDLAAAFVLTEFVEGLRNRFIRWDQENIDQQWAPELIMGLGSSLRKKALEILQRYRLWT